MCLSFCFKSVIHENYYERFYDTNIWNSIFKCQQNLNLTRMSTFAIKQIFYNFFVLYPDNTKLLWRKNMFSTHNKIIMIQ